MKMFAIMFVLFLAVKGDAHFEMPDHFFPIDPDDVTRLTEETSGPIPLAADFHMLTQTTNVINVNENGVLSFPWPMLESQAKYPRHSDRVWQSPTPGSFIASFWTDNMPSYHGQVLFQEYTPSHASAVIDKAKQLVNDNFPCIAFDPETVFVATWYQISTRNACVKEHSMEFCGCLDSDLHRGDVEFCKCSERHNEAFCARCNECLTRRCPEERFCSCLERTDNLDFCLCLQEGGSNCYCLREHDVHYCDCLAESNSHEMAWNCSCAANHPEDYCDCLRANDGNEAFCSCVKYLQPACDCYLSRTKSFCDCYYRLDGYEGFCDCVEEGKDEDFCGCVYFQHISNFNQVYLAEKYCECLRDRGNSPYTPSTYEYCLCEATQGADLCEQSGITKRADVSTCYTRAIENNLIREEGSTYQVAIISDGTFSFVVYNFGYWSTYMADNYRRSGSDEFYKYRTGNYYAGMKSDDPVAWPTNKRSYKIMETGQLPWCLLEHSNDGVPGQLMYRTDLFYLQKSGCVQINQGNEFVPLS